MSGIPASTGSVAATLRPLRGSVQLALWGEPGGSAAQPVLSEAKERLGVSADARSVELKRRLVALGLPAVDRFTTHRNRSVMISWLPGRALRVHEGYVHAPDTVLQAIVRFLKPGTRRTARLEARKSFLAFPAQDHAPSGRAHESPGRRAGSHPSDRPMVEFLSRLHQELNHEHFAGALGTIAIRVSRRMRRRLGELRLDHATGKPVEITLSRRHLRRDGFAAGRETLLHEMVHQWQAESGHPVDHGRVFRRKAREVGIEPRAVRLALGVDGPPVVR